MGRRVQGRLRDDVVDSDERERERERFFKCVQDEWQRSKIRNKANKSLYLTFVKCRWGHGALGIDEEEDFLLLPNAGWGKMR